MTAARLASNSRAGRIHNFCHPRLVLLSAPDPTALRDGRSRTQRHGQLRRPNVSAADIFPLGETPADVVGEFEDVGPVLSAPSPRALSRAGLGRVRGWWNKVTTPQARSVEERKAAAAACPSGYVQSASDGSRGGGAIARIRVATTRMTWNATSALSLTPSCANLRARQHPPLSRRWARSSSNPRISRSARRSSRRPVWSAAGDNAVTALTGDRPDRRARRGLMRQTRGASRIGDLALDGF